MHMSLRVRLFQPRLGVMEEYITRDGKIDTMARGGSRVAVPYTVDMELFVRNTAVSVKTCHRVAVCCLVVANL